MTQKERIIQYVLHTPCNNNRQILESLLLDLATGEFDFDLIKDKGAWEDKDYSKYSAVYDENGNIYIAIADVSVGTPLSDQSYWIPIMKDVEVLYDIIDGGKASGYKDFN